VPTGNTRTDGLISGGQPKPWIRDHGLISLSYRLIQGLPNGLISCPKIFRIILVFVASKGVSPCFAKTDCSESG
jgi:hypothetical protein